MSLFKQKFSVKIIVFNILLLIYSAISFYGFGFTTYGLGNQLGYLIYGGSFYIIASSISLILSLVLMFFKKRKVSKFHLRGSLLLFILAIQAFVLTFNVSSCPVTFEGGFGTQSYYAGNFIQRLAVGENCSVNKVTPLIPTEIITMAIFIYFAALSVFILDVLETNHNLTKSKRDSFDTKS